VICSTRSAPVGCRASCRSQAGTPSAASWSSDSYTGEHMLFGYQDERQAKAKDHCAT
jgi:hypothetical protein